jgi:hypothetical protein
MATVVKTSVATQAAKQGFGGARKSVSHWRARANTFHRRRRAGFTQLFQLKLSRSLSLRALRGRKKKWVAEKKMKRGEEN